MDEKSILVLGNDPLVQKALRELLASDGYDVDLAVSGPEALASLSTSDYSAIVLDPTTMELTHAGDNACIGNTPLSHNDSTRSQAQNSIVANESTVMDCVADSTHACLAYLDLNFNFLWVNSAYMRISCKSLEDLIGKNHFDLFPHAEYQALFEQVRDTGKRIDVKSKPFVDPSNPKRGIFYLDGSFTPITNTSSRVSGFVLSLVDVTEHVRNQQEIERLRYEAERRAEEVEDCRQVLETIMKLIPSGVIVADAANCRIELASDYACDLMGLPQGSLNGLSMDKRGTLWKMLRADDTTAEAYDYPLARALSKGEVVQDEEWTVQRLDGTKVVTLGSATPVKDKMGKLLAGVAVFRDITAIKESQSKLQKAYEREHRIAHVLQEAMLPTVNQDLPGLGIVAAYYPALKDSQVGGDFYDVFNLPDGRLAIVMGDVSGKGLDAAVHTAMAKYMLRAYAHQNPNPCSVMDMLNQAICDYTPTELFVTIFYGVIDPSARTLTYVDAGHDQPLLYNQASRSVVPLEVTGSAIGVVSDADYSQCQVQLAQGDVLLLYTDGISDARLNGQFFGIDHISEVLKDNADNDEYVITDRVFEAAQRFADGDLRDDAAVLVMKVR